MQQGNEPRVTQHVTEDILAELVSSLPSSTAHAAKFQLLQHNFPTNPTEPNIPEVHSCTALLEITILGVACLEDGLRGLTVKTAVAPT